ncbi:MAG TPA: hypothetical protein VLG13_00750 [Patescibacteria group bacterium]|nr:hypothetical protein [Patescibacteria group bacterium]
MKRLFWGLVLLFVVAPLGAGQAHADSMSVSVEIHITGIVPPMRNIVVDAKGNIIEITSNTPENVTPKVYVGSLQNGNEVPLTTAIQKDYEQKVQGKDLHSTDLHFSRSAPQTAKAAQPGWLVALRHISLMKLSPR